MYATMGRIKVNWIRFEMCQKYWWDVCTGGETNGHKLPKLLLLQQHLNSKTRFCGIVLTESLRGKTSGISFVKPIRLHLRRARGKELRYYSNLIYFSSGAPLFLYFPFIESFYRTVYAACYTICHHHWNCHRRVSTHKCNTNHFLLFHYFYYYYYLFI